MSQKPELEHDGGYSMAMAEHQNQQQQPNTSNAGGGAGGSLDDSFSYAFQGGYKTSMVQSNKELFMAPLSGVNFPALRCQLEETYGPLASFRPKTSLGFLSFESEAHTAALLASGSIEIDGKKVNVEIAKGKASDAPGTHPRRDRDCRGRGMRGDRGGGDRYYESGLEQTEDNFLDLDNSVVLPDGGYSLAMAEHQNQQQPNISNVNAAAGPLDDNRSPTFQGGYKTAMVQNNGQYYTHQDRQNEQSQQQGQRVRRTSKVHPNDALQLRLEGNPYFPEDELDLVPALESIAPDLAQRLFVITRPDDAAALERVEWALIKEIETDAACLNHHVFPLPDLCCVERVTIRNWHGGDSLVPRNQGTASRQFGTNLNNRGGWLNRQDNAWDSTPACSMNDPGRQQNSNNSQRGTTTFGTRNWYWNYQINQQQRDRQPSQNRPIGPAKCPAAAAAGGRTGGLARTGLSAHIAAQRNALRVDATHESPSGSSCTRFIKTLFSSSPSAHTLTLNQTDIHSATFLVSAQLPFLRRLVLQLSDDVTSDEKFCSQAFFEAIAQNPILESVVLLNQIPISGDSLALLQEKKPPVKFGSTVDKSQPPPSVAASRDKSRTDIPRSLPIDTNAPEVCKLLLGSGGYSVPLHTSLVHRCLLLESMLESVPPKERGEITLSMEPLVSESALTLAMIFVTRIVTSDIHEQCAKLEDELLGAGTRQEGAKKTFVKKTSHTRARCCTWSREFESFWQYCIQEEFSAKKQVLILCELMSVATYLNIPSLKRFVRAALPLSQLESSSEFERGKREQ